MNFRILDTTLRDGEQAPGVCFSPQNKVEILKKLYAAGIRDFEIGTPAICTEERFAIKEMLSLGLDANLSVWCRATIADLEKAYQLGIKMVNVSLPLSDLQLNAIGKDKKWVLGQLYKCLDYANERFEFIAVGAQDGSRTNDDFLAKYIQVASQFPSVKRIRLADTVGILNPFSVFEWFNKYTTNFPDLEFEFHGHNDLGMATANALAAYKGGAHLVSTTINGIGERCGNTPLEELVIALQYSESINMSIDKTILMDVCELVEHISNRKVHDSKPFNGAMCFTHESGIHTRSLLNNELAYQAYNPSDVGKSKRFLFGKHSGRSAIKAIFNNRNINIDEITLNRITAEVKRYVTNQDGLNEDEVLSIFFKINNQERKNKGLYNIYK